MLPSLGEAVLKLRADKAQLQGDVNAAKGDIEKSLSSIGKSMTKVGAGMTAGVTLPLVAMGAVALNSGAELGEAIEKIPPVFGTASQSVIDFANTTAKQLGISKQEALTAAKTFGLMFTGMGVGQQDAANMSTSLTTLAADIAEFNGITPSEALDQLLSGMAGRGMQLKKMGVDLSDAAVKAKALQMNLLGADGELSEAAAAQARYALIMDQTATVQGAFARSSGDLGNSMAVTKAQLADASAKLGVQLIPMALKAVNAISKLVDWFTNMSPAGQKVMLVVAGIVAAIGPLLTGVGSLITFITAIGPAISAAAPVLAAIGTVITGPIGIAIAAIIALVGLLFLAWNTNFFGIRTTFQTVWNSIKLIFAAFSAAFHGDWRQFGELLRAAWDNLWNLVVVRFNAGVDTVKNIFTTVIDWIKGVFNIDWGELGKKVIDGIISGLQNGVAALIEAAKNVAGSVGEAFKGFFGIQSPSKLMEMEVGLPIAAGIGVGIQNGMKALNSRLAGSMNASLSTFQGLTMKPAGAANTGRSSSIQIGDIIIQVPPGASPAMYAKSTEQGVRSALRAVGAA